MRAARPPQARRGGPHRDGLELRDGGHGGLLHLGQHEHAPQLFGQVFQEVVEQRRRALELHALIGLRSERLELVGELAGGFAPAIAAKVGSRSIVAPSSRTMVGFTVPGCRKMPGTRIPPSQVELLPIRSRPAEPPWSS